MIMKMKNAVNAFMKDESGLGTIELVLLVIILVGLAILFKGSIVKFFTDLTVGFNAKTALDNVKY